MPAFQLSIQLFYASSLTGTPLQKIALHIELGNYLLNMQHISSVDTNPSNTTRGKARLSSLACLPSWEPKVTARYLLNC